jgi:Lon protease-like protein
VVTLPKVIPLFPLPNVVLFPQMPLPLHVFEPRYRQLVSDAEGGSRIIGISLLGPGWEADYQGRPALYDVGCAGTLEQCDPLETGRYNILLRGVTRFRIVEEHAGQPYRLATVEPLADDAGQPDALDAARKRIMAAIGKAADGPTVLVLKSELPHEIFVNALCQSLPLTPVERQSLLTCDSLLSRYERLLEILDFKVLEQTYGRGDGEKVH